MRWILWFAMLNSVVIIRLVLGPRHLVFGPEAGAAGVPPAKWLLVLIPMLFALAVRLFLLPRSLHHSVKTLVAMILGCAVSEGMGFFGIFLFPGYTDLVCGLSVLLLLSFCPLFTPSTETSAEPAQFR